MSTVRRTKIRGVTHNDPHSGINRQAVIKQFLAEGVSLRAVLEPDNPVNPRAVALWVEVDNGHTYHLGYLSDEIAEDVATRLEQGSDVTVTVSEVTGGVYGKPTRGVNITIRDSAPQGDSTASDNRPRPDTKSTTKALLVVIAVVIIIFLACIIIAALTGDPETAILY